MDEQISFLGSLGLPEQKPKLKKAPKKKPEKQAEEKPKKIKKRSIDEIFEESLLWLEGNRCPRCGTSLKSRHEADEDILFCPNRAGNCTFEMPEEKLPYVLKRAKELIIQGDK